METAERPQPRVVVLHLHELDRDTAPAILRRLNDLDPAERVVVDVSAARFCDVGGLWPFVNRALTHRTAGGSLQIVGPCPTMLQCIEALELQDLLLEA
jgi:anti-anti-sigma regulatory factor